ncbi:MAG: MBL fold metallo-hydrolase [Halofilum sp. (in: g-proteobacteria)]|nr:MBL fold metallo-hydrolase [Halofilum sp. (in: g-proteobacteria)]
MRPEVRHVLHEPSSTFSYVVWDPQTRHAAIIDPALDFDQNSGQTGTATPQRLVDIVREEGLTVDWILETHAHADHVTAAQFVQDQVGGQIGIGEGIRQVQAHFREVFGLERGFLPDGSQFDHLFADGENFQIGEIEARTIATPGHTNDHMTYIIGDACFVGDTLFMPDAGTARCDFPGGSAHQLYQSVQRVFRELPDETRMFILHDYGKGGQRELRNETTVGEQRRHNIHVGEGVGEDEYVRMRTERDATLNLPTLIIPSVQLNIRAGEMPPADEHGHRYLKVPIDAIDAF